MPKIKYKDCNFRNSTLQLIQQCNSIIDEYTADGLRLTLRQLYYQLVSRDVIPNTVKEYNRLGNTVNDARLAGLIDWSSIEDRTRNLATIGHWNDPASIIESAAHSFRIDKWADQPYRVEVWIEKEALAGVFERICNTLDVPYLSCRGYTSQSEMWAAAMRFVGYIQKGKTVKIFHFGDHDPSGIDMSRDIEDRIHMFVAHHTNRTNRFEIERVALNMDQVEEYHPPENPAKVTDTRFADYEAKFGESSWELDALNPRVLAALVRDNVTALRDPERWKAACNIEAGHRATLDVISDHYSDVHQLVEDEWHEELGNATLAQLDQYNDGEDGEE